MPDTYTYEVRDQSGKTISGTIVADSQALVLERLKEQGMVPVKVALQKQVGLKMEFNVRTKVKLKDLAIFSRQFSTMISSGLPMLRALAILENQTELQGAAATAVAEVRQDVERGLVAVGVDGQAPEGLQQPVRGHGASRARPAVSWTPCWTGWPATWSGRSSLRGRIKSAMTYPIVVLGFVTLIMMAMLLFIVPQFKSIYAELHGTLPLPDAHPARGQRRRAHEVPRSSSSPSPSSSSCCAVEEDDEGSRMRWTSSS